MKIFLTGDNHLGLYVNESQKKILIENRIAAFKGMVDCANQEGCSLFVISGDLFDNTRGISKRETKRLLNMLSEFEGTVSILPGNHDYYDPDLKVWKTVNELLPGYHNIMILNEYKPYDLVVEEKKVTLYPAFCTSKHSQLNENNLDWIKKEEMNETDVIRIGIAHGAVDGETIDNEGRYFLMTREELEKINVDCWLIGHTHVPFPKTLETDRYVKAGRIFNAGTHVQTDVNCNTEGLCFIIDIDEHKQITAKKFQSGNIRFYRKTVEVSGKSLKEAIENTLTGIENNSVVELIFKGAVAEEEYKNRKTIIENELARFTEGTYEDAELSRLITADLISKEFPETSFTYAFLNGLSENPKELQLAYELIQNLKEGKTK